MKNSKGFTAIEGLLIVVIIGIIGGTGYYVWNSRQQTNKVLTAAQNETSAVKVSKKSTPASSTATETSGSASTSQKYLDVKELAIKVPVPASISDLSYSWHTDSGGSSALIQSQTQMNTMKPEDPSCATADIGYLTATPKFDSDQSAVTINSKNFYFYPTAYNCQYTQASSNLLTANITAVKSAVKATVHD